MQARDTNPVYLVPYVGLLFGAFVMRVLIDRFLAASRELETLNLGLEQRVAAQHLELRQALGQMREARDAAEAADRAKTRFLAAASHDLRQPAHALGLYVATLRGLPLTPEQEELTGRIASSVDALDAMFNTLLDVSRIDGGAVLPRVERVDLAQLLQRLADEFAPQAEGRGLRLALRMAPGRPVTLADPLLLERVVRNLLANAVKYTTRGGLLLACRLRTAPDGERRWRIEVWDSGRGVEPQVHERIFEEYYQVGNPARDRRQGLGLGLAIVRRLAQLMDLKVTLRSRPGRGSVFRLEGLVVADASETVRDEDAAVTGPLLRGRTVAVIEDDLDVRAAMRSLLRLWGCEVAEGDDARTVLHRLGSQAADAVIADVRLAGGRDGPHEVQALLGAWRRRVPVLIVTGETAPDSVQRLGHAGLDWMAKPLAADRLLAWLTQALHRPGEFPQESPT
jgi:signal transduction histidine kinase/ActR/RegA family two-component response regulator